MSVITFPINRIYWQDFTEEQLEFFVEEIFTHYRTVGFPYHRKSVPVQKQAMKDMDDFCYNNAVINNKGIIKLKMHCISTAWCYFPHAYEIRCSKRKTPMEIFNDDAAFKRLIRKQLKMDNAIGDPSIRKRLANFTGTQGVSNFRPTAARAIYDKYLSEPGRVYDMSCGFGGRLLGALSSPKVKEYIGTEPCQKTVNGLLEINKNLNVIDTSYECWWSDDDEIGTPRKNVVIHQLGSEDFLPDKESLDLCFTSPPYFNTEEYDTAPTQSYIKFPTPELWFNDFLMKTVENCYYGLKRGAFLIINIANVKSYKTLESDLLQGIRRLPFDHVETLKLELAAMGGRKFEPVFVFRKCG